jgi:hypothetical protein
VQRQQTQRTTVTPTMAANQVRAWGFVWGQAGLLADTTVRQLLESYTRFRETSALQCIRPSYKVSWAKTPSLVWLKPDTP